MFPIRRSVVLGLTVALLSACIPGNRFETAYDPVAASVSQGWRLSEVRVHVPKTLVVSEAKSLLPNADIVWREDPLGDRYAQVDTILTDAIRQGAQSLRGSRPILIDVTVTRFHALTFEAELRGQDWGVHNVDFTARVIDASTGEVLLRDTQIRAELPAFSGAQMVEARKQGQTQKLMISAHVARTVAGWLGIGPDNRGVFTRSGN